ncbi:MAG TPA: 2-C-methyl-D-erythritol 4-phosphate cytidylyltransferase [Bryobacteraceae bacterium]|nr:2-C-methyl-D-erythritol 4-phosphate cytidylyltransferase [Bryobacteraceae bacterium]
MVAAGSGKRLGSDLAKAFVPLAGHPMLFYALRTIASVDSIIEAVVAVPAGMEAQARAIADSAALQIPIKLTPGGSQRQHSVHLALQLTSAESDLVIVHDAARPFATRSIFEACLEAASRAGGAIAAVPVADTLKRADGKTIIATVARDGLWQAQTPQAFRRELLVLAHRQAEADATAATDDADLVERLGAKVEIVDGAALNFKITTPADLRLAAALARPYLAP